MPGQCKARRTRHEWIPPKAQKYITWALASVQCHRPAVTRLRSQNSPRGRGTVRARCGTFLMLPEISRGEEALSQPLRQELIEVSGWWTGAGHVCRGGGSFTRFYVAFSHFTTLPPNGTKSSARLVFERGGGGGGPKDLCSKNAPKICSL